MAGRTVLVTGGTGGIGKATALRLAAMGARVAVTGRDPARAHAAAREIQDDHGVEVMAFVADLSSQSEVRRLADEVQDALPRLDVLVNNVGGYWNTRHVTVDGLEHTFALNHLAPFLLTNLLVELLTRNAPARVVTVASNAQAQGRIDFDDLQGERSYSGARAYNQSKLANVLFSYELARRLGDQRRHGQRPPSGCGEHVVRCSRPRRRAAMARPRSAALHEVLVPRSGHLRAPGSIARARAGDGSILGGPQAQEVVAAQLRRRNRRPAVARQYPARRTGAHRLEAGATCPGGAAAESTCADAALARSGRFRPRSPAWRPRTALTLTGGQSLRCGISAVLAQNLVPHLCHKRPYRRYVKASRAWSNRL